MNGEYAVSKILRDSVPVTAIVGNRVYLNEAPQGAKYPLVIVSEDGIEPFDTKDGKSVTEHDRIRVFPYTETKSALKTLADACRYAVDHIAKGVYNGVPVVWISFQGQTSFDEQIVNRKVYAKDQEYLVRVGYGITAGNLDITADSTEITADNF